MTRSHQEPRGAEGRPSRSVYIRRRIAVLAALIACVAIIVMLIAGPQQVAAWFGGSGETEGPPLTQNTVSGSGDSTPSESDATGEPEQSTKPAEPGPCEPERLGVAAVTDKTNYGSEDRPKLSLRVTNHSEVACDADLGTETMGFVVMSGSEVYWDSRHCQINPESTLVRMEPGQTLETEPLEWNRSRSTPETCDEDERPSVPGGGASYHLTVEVAGVRSSTTQQFLLY